MKKKPPAPAKQPAPEAPAPLRHRALEGLKSVVPAVPVTPARPEAPARAKPLPPPTPAPDARTHVWRPDLDKELFDVAMSGVKPLARGRAHATRVPGPRQQREPTDAKMRKRSAEGGTALTVRWLNDAECEGARPGRSFALEALERFAEPQETLDLHGVDAESARSRVEDFVRTRRARRLRVVAIVHGMGRHAPDGASVLRDAVVRALSQPPAASDVDAFRTMATRNGPSGAILVALRT